MIPNNSSLISIIVPCRNEEKFIGKCLDSIVAQDYPHENWEVLVVDGMSEDGTRDIIKKYIREHPFIRLLDNPKKITPCALNIGIKHAEGGIIMRMDAHATYKEDYVSMCIKYLKEYDADNVGGIWKIVPREETLVAKSIVFASSSVFGAGNAYYRRGYSKGLKWVDTVFGGCYRKEVFRKIGLFNENLVRSQDMEFNLRLKKAGLKTLLVPEIVSYYYPCSNLKAFFEHNFHDGIWAIYPLKFVKIPFSLRHYLPLLFVSSLIVSAILLIFFRVFLVLLLFIMSLYFFADVYFSIKIAFKKKNLRYSFIMPIVFATRHIGYGLGSIWGLIKYFTIGKEKDYVKKNI